eukprot:3936765-Rhodomonas_salina.1
MLREMNLTSAQSSNILFEKLVCCDLRVSLQSEGSDCRGQCCGTPSAGVTKRMVLPGRMVMECACGEQDIGLGYRPTRVLCDARY